MNFADFRTLLAARDCKPAGNGSKFASRCPAHKDRTPSLSIAEGAHGKILVHCHRGCSVHAIVSALGLTMADLFADKPKRNGDARIVEIYDYRDQAGALLFQVCRFAPKDFRQRKPNGAGGWTWSVKGVRRVPFRLPELVKGVANSLPIFIVEGEKDALAMANAGFVATCNPGGAGKWQKDFSDYFRGAEVTILPDRDGIGRRHAERIAASLHGIAGSIRVVELPDVEGRAVKDAADYFDAGGGAAELDQLVQAAPLWTPAPPPATGASDFDKTTAEMRGEIIGWLMSKESAATIRNEVAKLIVATLAKVGRFYFHADLRDFDSAMYFDAAQKRLSRIRSDAFNAWLSEWVGINRAEALFRHVIAAVETTALSGSLTTGIVPEAYWASRPGTVYLSNGDGRAMKVTAAGVQIVDNGTDSVLFASGKTLTPWKLIEVRDPFVTCRLFREARCSAAHGLDLLRLWFYSLPTNPRSKPPLCAAGDVGSGKTRTAKGFAELLGIPFIAQKVEDQAEAQFWPCVNEGGVFTLDNADTRCKWLPDALAAAATDGCSQRRKLYKDSETVTLRARAWIVITSANPSFAADAGLADRLLVVRMVRREGQNDDGALSEEIAANRDAGLSHVAQTLHRALADTSPVPPGLNQRHPDFGDIAVRIGRALGREPQALAALQAAEADKAAFCLENDIIAAALLAFLREARTFTGTAAELVPHLVATDADLAERLSARRLSKRLSAIWPHLQGVLKTAHREQDRKGFSIFTLKTAEPADYADYQTAIP